jgi:hypothetical protein
VLSPETNTKKKGRNPSYLQTLHQCREDGGQHGAQRGQRVWCAEHVIQDGAQQRAALLLHLTADKGQVGGLTPSVNSSMCAGISSGAWACCFRDLSTVGRERGRAGTVNLAATVLAVQQGHAFPVPCPVTEGRWERAYSGTIQ